MLAWALVGRPAEPRIPDGYRLDLAAKAWMDERQPENRFTNALGTSAQGHRTFRNQFARVLFDSDGEPAAVAGVFDTAGLSEIGVDVAPAHRRSGLSQIVVAAASRDILEMDKTPFYVCEVRNIWSQHTALASGFLPVCSLSLVMSAQ